jgi:hypothetical protein
MYVFKTIQLLILNVFTPAIMKFFLIIYLFLACNFSNSQTVVRVLPDNLVTLAVVNGDTMPQIVLPQVIIMPPKVYSSKKEQIKFLKLVRKIKKVLPYAKLANNTLREINTKLEGIDDKRTRKKYINEVDKVLKERYGEELKNLTISEGRILIKLIDRETGSTSYELVSELKGSFTAFMWQSLARLFGENLKQNYDSKGEDKLIEEILLRIEAGQY